MKDFLRRSYRIVNNMADDNDIDLTNIHTYLAHVLLAGVYISVFVYH